MVPRRIVRGTRKESLGHFRDAPLSGEAEWSGMEDGRSQRIRRCTWRTPTSSPFLSEAYASQWSSSSPSEWRESRISRLRAEEPEAPRSEVELWPEFGMLLEANRNAGLNVALEAQLESWLPTVDSNHD